MIKFDNANDIIVDDDILTEEDFEFINKRILDKGAFPFFAQSATNEINVMSHEFIGRKFDGKIWSEKYFRFFETIVERFCKKHSLSFKTVYRACVNLGFENSKFKHTHPHLDFNFNEIDDLENFRNVLIYLNDVKNDPGYNSTILFKEKGMNLDGKKDTITELSDFENLTIEQLVPVKKGRIVCYHGLRYHANYFSKGNEFRYVAVFNFS